MTKMLKKRSLKEKVIILLICSVFLCIAITVLFVVLEMMHPTEEIAFLFKNLRVVEFYA